MAIRTLLLAIGFISTSLIYGNTTDKDLDALRIIIDRADAQAFKIAYGTSVSRYFRTTPYPTQEEFINAMANLLDWAQEKRNRLQLRYTSLSTAKQYQMLAKGIGQCYVGLCGALGVGLSTTLFIKVILKYKFNTLLFNSLGKLRDILIGSRIAIPAVLIADPIGSYITRQDFTGHEKEAIVAYLIPTLIAYIAAKYCLPLGVQNFKQGWNYKAHLEKQLKNVDEIIAYIEASNDNPIAKELR